MESHKAFSHKRHFFWKRRCELIVKFKEYRKTAKYHSTCHFTLTLLVTILHPLIKLQDNTIRARHGTLNSPRWKRYLPNPGPVVSNPRLIGTQRHSCHHDRVLMEACWAYSLVTHGKILHSYQLPTLPWMRIGEGCEITANRRKMGGIGVWK